jgi:hypothetical protein
MDWGSGGQCRISYEGRRGWEERRDGVRSKRVVEKSLNAILIFEQDATLNLLLHPLFSVIYSQPMLSHRRRQSRTFPHP